MSTSIDGRSQSDRLAHASWQGKHSRVVRGSLARQPRAPKVEIGVLEHRLSILLSLNSGHHVALHTWLDPRLAGPAVPPIPEGEVSPKS